MTSSDDAAPENSDTLIESPAKTGKVSSEPLIDHIENLDRTRVDFNHDESDETVSQTDSQDSENGDVETDNTQTMAAENPESTIVLESVSPDVVIATLETPESEAQDTQVISEAEDLANQKTDSGADPSLLITDDNAEIIISAESDSTPSTQPTTADDTVVISDAANGQDVAVQGDLPASTSNLQSLEQNEQAVTDNKLIENKLIENKLASNSDTIEKKDAAQIANEIDEQDKSHDEIHEEEEKVKEVKEAKLESYKQFVAEQFSKQKVDYPEVRVKIEANALPTRMYFVMNILSAIIASYGLVTNSAAVVIGAMLVAMMLGPITGVALAVIDNRIPLLRKSLFTVAAGVFIVIFVGFIIGLLHNNQPLTAEILSRTQPTSMDLMIALAGGTAGAYAMVSPHLSVAVVGVAVATALVPPLAASGILFANGELTLGFGAALLALTNIIAIQFTNAMVLWILGFRRLVDGDYQTSTYLTFLRRNAVALLLLGVLGTYLTINLQTNAKQQVFESNVKKTINEHFIEKGNVLTNTQFTKGNGNQIVRAVVRGETTPSSYDVNQIEAIITQDMADNFPGYLPIKLQLRYLPVQVIESNPLITDKLDETDAAILTN